MTATGSPHGRGGVAGPADAGSPNGIAPASGPDGLVVPDPVAGPAAGPRQPSHRRSLVAVASVALLALLAIVLVGGPRLLDPTPRAALGAPHFVDETSAAGIAHVYDGGAAFAVGGGMAAFDCDADGRPDLYVAGGSNPAALYRNESPVGGPLRFTAVPDPAVEVPNVIGAYPIDLDGDGVADLAVLRVGGVDLLRGLGGCRFERANDHLGFSSPGGWTTAFSATWEGSARLPTLAVGRYLTLDAGGSPAFDCDTSALFRPDASASRYGPPLTLAPGFCTLSMLFSDWDRSGRRDLRVSNDANYYDPSTGQEQLWRMVPGEAPRLYTTDDGWVGVQVDGMGIASYDLTGDGYPEVFLTSQADNRLQTLAAGPAQPRYRDIAAKRGVTSARPFTGGDVLPSTAWHPEFQDVNDDGFVDLYVSKGNVNAQPGFATRDPSDLFLGAPDGTFREAADAAGIVSYDRSRGAALVDLDLDGLPDLVQVAYGAPMRVWRNVGSGDAGHAVAMGRWLELRVAQAGPDRDAIGGWVEVRVGDLTMRRELTIGGGHASGELGWLHVGLGSAAGADVRVIWPDGETGSWSHVDADRFYEIERGAGPPRTWEPPRG